MSKVLIVTGNTDLRRVKCLFQEQKLPLRYRKAENVGTVGCKQPAHIIYRDATADCFRPESNILCLHDTTLKIINSLSQRCSLSTFCSAVKKCLRQVNVFAPSQPPHIPLRHKGECHLMKEPSCLTAV